MVSINVTLSGQITGTISDRHSITGTIFLPTSYRMDYPEYGGVTDVIPDANDDQVLPTKDTLVLDDITVFKIPAYETSNEVGKTFIIAS